MLCKGASESSIFLINQVNRRRAMASLSLKILMVIGRRTASFDSQVGLIFGIGRALVRLARSSRQRWPVNDDPSSRALSQLDDDQLSNLSESGLRARREARLRARTHRPACR